MVKSKDNLISAWAFLIGIVLAVFIGLYKQYSGYTFSNLPYAVLVILGFIVGSLKFGDRDSMTFLLASVSLVIVSGMGQGAFIYLSNIPILGALNSVLNALLVLFVPATIIVALKTVFSIAKI